MTDEKGARRWRRALWAGLPVAAGVLVLVLALRVGKEPARTTAGERAQKVRIIALAPTTVVPAAVGYGTVQPGRRWDAVAEVSGRVVWIADAVKDGGLAKKGALLLRIDPAPYKLNLALVEAQFRASQVKDRTTRSSIAIAERNQSLLKADFERNQKLLRQGTVSKGAAEAAEQRMLAGAAALQNLRNALQISAAERGVLESQLAAARLDLAHTTLRAPFAVRLTDIQIGLAQYANKGQRLFSADGLDVAEIAAQFPVGRLRPLVQSVEQKGTETDPVRGALRLHASVQLQAGTHVVNWPARVDRVSGTIDPQTQSLGVVVAVDDPIAQARPGERPPLIRNTFVQVELRGASLAAQLVVPRAAVHQGHAYVVTDGNRLELRPVGVRFTQGTLSVIGKGLQPGERVVVSDLVPALPGMLLDPQPDTRLQERLAAEAAGREGAP